MTENYAQKPTQRAYTLLLRGADPIDRSWRERAWTTHEAVNKGAKVFGEWLLTLRGGLSHTLVDMPVIEKKQKEVIERLPSEQEKRDRRVVLALSWLSVESERGAPEYEEYIVARALDKRLDRRAKAKTVDALEEILKLRGLEEGEIAQWVEDCSPTLAAEIRDDAVWVNRSKVFDQAGRQIGTSPTQADTWDFISPFLGEPSTYLAGLQKESEDEAAEKSHEPVQMQEKAKDLVQKAGQWLSSRFGTGVGANFAVMADVYETIQKWAVSATLEQTGTKTIADLSKALAPFNPGGTDVIAVLSLIKGPGYKSTTRNLLKAMADEQSIMLEDVERLKKSAYQDAQKCRSKAGVKGHRAYADAVLDKVEQSCGMKYISADGTANHGEFSVLLDHAARRVSLQNTWIRRAETQRRKFDREADMIELVPDAARTWLDQLCLRRSADSGAVEPYRIRRRAIDGWEQVVSAWSRKGCNTAEARVDTARALQQDPELKKFGDIQLFEALASEEALPVWKPLGVVDSRPLKDYVAATEAQFKRQNFKVPAYRHPDPFHHPVFCDFGESRFGIKYAVHEASRKIKASLNKFKRRGDEVWRARDSSLRPKSNVERDLHKAEHKLAETQAALLSNKDAHGVSLSLWSGSEIQRTLVRWQGKRLTSDLAISVEPATGEREYASVSRGDRLGRAAVSAGQEEAIEVVGIFEQNHWNGRLQAPRQQLERLGKYVATHGWNDQARSMRDQLRWFLTFSPRLQSQGPWNEFAKRRGLLPNPTYFPHSKENRKRNGLSRLILCRIPGLRVLSVDLGHRYACACAVWETLSFEDFRVECDKARDKGGMVIVSEEGLHALIRYPERQSNAASKRARLGCRVKKFKPTTLYRRIGPDMIDGSTHPAPWARLDRQFTIKLQGEAEAARKASPAEICFFEGQEHAFGKIHSERRNSQVDELMSSAVRTADLALRRHGRRAKICHNLVSRVKVISGGRPKALTFEERKELIAQTLVDWHSLAHDKYWIDDWAKNVWNQHIDPHLKGTDLPGLPGEVSQSSQDMKRYRNELQANLTSVAEFLAQRDNKDLHKTWCDRWNQDDQQWPQHLRMLKRWILPPGSDRENPAIRHVGGLSLTRIATIQSLYRLHRSHSNRPDPRDLRKNITTGKGSAENLVGREILKTMDRMRVNRIKQIASRIVEAALGIGIERSNSEKKFQPRPRQRINDPRFAPCQAIIVENLDDYRPDQTRTRRENRALMQWAASNVKKYLAESCELHGLHLRQVPAAYTSLQDSRTGAPGIRCQDIAVADFVKRSGFLWGRIKSALNACKARQKPSQEQLYLADLHARWDEESRTWNDGKDVVWLLDTNGQWNRADGTLTAKGVPNPVRIPQQGGEIFVSASSEDVAANGLQADLNAAANIGLKALLDPDWEGRWWYVPCDGKDFKPLADRVQGSIVLDVSAPLKCQEDQETRGANMKCRKRENNDGYDKPRINLWRYPNTTSLQGSGGENDWMPYTAYWNTVRARVINILRRHHGLGEAR